MWPVVEILLGITMLLISMLIHSAGMYVVMHRFELNWPDYLNARNELRRQIYFFYLVTLILMTHLFEILVIATIVNAIHAMPDFRTAFYFAGETYTTLGYGDLLLPQGWRQLALFIAMSGLFTFGWTTGVLVRIVGKTYDAQFAHLRQHQHGEAEGESTRTPHSK
ncbi:MAG: two pore domain potassium channel family protein [Betaproteobacteria bacterium]|nr:two pore domain potassium channel family protein [Betaproteobacteria bacterium]